MREYIYIYSIYYAYEVKCIGLLKYNNGQDH